MTSSLVTLLDPHMPRSGDTDSSSPITSSDSLSSLIWLLLVSSIAVLLGFLLTLSFQQVEKQTQSDIRNLNLTLEARLNEGLLQRLQASMSGIASSVAESNLSGSFDAESTVTQLQAIAKRFPDIPYFDVLDAAGNRRFRTDERLDYPSFTPSNQEAALPWSGAITQRGKLVITHDKGSSQLQVVVPILNGQSSVTGWIVTSLQLTTVLDLLEQVDVGRHGVVTIRRTDKPEIVLRHPAPENPYREYKSDQIDRILASGAKEGFVHMISRVDNTERLYGFLRIGNYPLVVVTGLATREYRAGWWYMAITSIAAFLLLGAVIYGLKTRLRATQRREDDAVEDLRISEKRMRLLINSVGQLIIGVDSIGNGTVFNMAAAKAFGVSSVTELSSSKIGHHFETPGYAPFGLVTRVLDTIQAGEAFHCEDTVFQDAWLNKIPVEIHAYPNQKNGEFTGAVITLRDISERKQAEQRIRHLAYHDALTKLPNRLQMGNRFQEAIKDVETFGARIALLYLDLDNFKTINDSLGHQFGDAVLRGFAERLVNAGARFEAVARFGGDEYLLLVNVTSEDSLADTLGALLHSASQPYTIDGYQLTVTCSIGVALAPEHGMSFDTLLKAADAALHRAKQAGRNTFAIYEPEMGEHDLRRLQIQVNLRHAHENGKLTIHYQPQMDIVSGMIIGAEALLRWNDPERGMISPAEFIPIAESSGLILPITTWLLGEACAQAAAWHQAGFGRLSIAVNCSAILFSQGNLVADVIQALEESGLPSRYLELELTESTLIEDSDQVADCISRLKAVGVKLAIDDFGTGYSSMAYLKRLAVDKLKIDQSFVRGMIDQPDDKVIVQAMINLAHDLGLNVIAEGVERPDELSALLDAGCDSIQGYLIAKPMSARDFDTFMQHKIITS